MTRLLFVALLSFAVEPALAHPGERGLVLLLPTGLYMLGGALAVVCSFGVMALLPLGAVAKWTSAAPPRSDWRADSLVPSAIALVLLAGLIAAGYLGSRDPLDNPLPLVVWTLWWVGFTFLVVLAGDLWRKVNPWRAAARMLPPRPLLPYPERLGDWPGVVLLLAFAWFELVYPAPQDPARLATAVLAYAVITLAGMRLYGERAWLSHAEAFSIFYRLLSRLSPRRFRTLLHAEPLSPSAVAFVAVMLATVSFDGLSRTFWWLDLIGENPLEHPGRSALVGRNSVGLLATALLIGGLYVAAARRDYGRYVSALIPIAFGYHFAHYLPAFLVDVQYAARALSDPFALGWNLLGTRDLQPSTSFLAHHSTVHAMWNIQVTGIVLAHVVAVFIAHAIALRRHATVGAALVSQVPITLLMIGYTVFGLWLLSTPVAA